MEHMCKLTVPLKPAPIMFVDTYLNILAALLLVICMLYCRHMTVESECYLAI